MKFNEVYKTPAERRAFFEQFDLINLKKRQKLVKSQPLVIHQRKKLLNKFNPLMLKTKI